jgi:hypothetical protein
MLDHVVIDTNRMPVQEDPRHPGKLTQILLSPQEMGGAVVRISYWPPGFTQKLRALIAGKGHRHYHRSVNERHYVLGGDWTILHWPESAKADPIQTKMHRHHYLENPPKVLHGISDTAPPVTGTKFLVWTSGAGTDIYEPAAKLESIDVEFGEEAPPDVHNSPIVFNAEDRKWQPHPSQPGWRVKQLSPPVEGLPGVTLVNIPAGARQPVDGLTPAGTVKHWVYVISGDLALEASSVRGVFPVDLVEGGFCAWTSESEVTNADREISAGGAVVLCVGHTLGRTARASRS